MSENNLSVDENQIHYVYDDDNQEYILNEESEMGQEFGDLICSDGSRGILVDGQYILTDSQAIFLQEGEANNLTQYYINNNFDGLVVDNEENSISSMTDTAEYVQLVEEDTNDGQQIIYYTNEDTNAQDENVGGIQDEEGNIYPFKKIKLEGHLMNFDDFIQHQQQQEQQIEDVEEVHQQQDDSNQQSLSSDDFYSDEFTIMEEDLSKITGKNLITGQTVTLHSYMEKLKKRINKNHRSSNNRSPKKLYSDGDNIPLKGDKKDNIDSLLDKKISIGRTKTGKKIVGRIIHVERKNNPETNKKIETKNEIEEDEEEEEMTKVLVKKCTVGMESFEQISKTLGGVMEMESVRKKLENKNIVVKLVEKKYVSETETFDKNISYSYGYMEHENGQADKWRFVPDQDTQDVLLGDENSDKKTTKYPITTSLTIVITHEKAGNKTIRVNLNPAPGNLCTICAQYFKTNLQLRQHVNQVHNTFKDIVCEVCNTVFTDVTKLQDHRNIHVQEGSLFLCNLCDKGFTSPTKFHKHLPMHDLYLKPLECSLCKTRCASENALKKHLLTHTGLKPFLCDICGQQFNTPYNLTFHKKIHFPENHYTCNVCMRTFSRYSNLLRHTEIHKGTGTVYKCDICYCSYNYISSLTRHMVQNHLEEFRRREKNNATKTS